MNSILQNTQSQIERLYYKLTLIPTSPRNHYERGSRKSVRTRSSGQLHGNRTFQTQQGMYTHELTTIATAHTRLLQAQARLNPIMEIGGVNEVPALTEELLTVVNC